MTSTKECPELISQLILSQLDLGATLGALYTGASLSAIVYGITCCQAFCYYRSEKAKHDSWILRAFVAFLMVLVTFQQALITETCYDYMVSHYDDPCALLKIIWPAMTSVLFESIIGGLVRCFLIRRVWLLSRNRYLTVFCSVVIAAHLALTLVLSVKGYINPDVFAELLGLQPVAIAGYSVSSLADMSISASIIFYLYRSRTGFRRSDDIISKLMLLTVSTGLLTTVVMVVGLIMCAVFPGTYYSVTIEFILTKLYINSLLTTLNIRDSIRERPIEGTTGLMNSVPLSDHHKNPPPPRVNIRIDHIVESDRTKHVALGPVESKYSTEKQNQVTGSDTSDAEEMC